MDLTCPQAIYVIHVHNADNHGLVHVERVSLRPSLCWLNEIMSLWLAGVEPRLKHKRCSTSCCLISSSTCESKRFVWVYLCVFFRRHWPRSILASGTSSCGNKSTGTWSRENLPGKVYQIAIRLRNLWY